MARFVQRVLRLPAFPISLVIALAACATQNEADQRSDPPDQQIRDAADALLQDLHDRGLFNGAVVLGRAGEEVYARGFGPANVEVGVPFTPDTPADGASMAKTFAAASILMLQDEGRLSLDDAVRQYVPEYPHATTQVGQLITHSAGLPGPEFFFPLWPEDEILTTTGVLHLLGERGVEPEFEPGTRFRYCNLCYDVAALVAERITGVRWDDFLRERMFAPLGMDSTFLRPARLADWPGVRTLSYRQQGGGLEPFNGIDNWAQYGAANLYFSTRDLYRWSRSFYTRPVLSSAVLSAGREGGLIRDPETGTGHRTPINLLSWYYSTEARRYQYGGFLPGFVSTVYRDEDRRYSVVYMTNNNIPTWLWPLLTRALIDIMEGRVPGALDRPRYAELDSENLDAVAGMYSVPGIGTLTLDTRAGEAVQELRRGVVVATLRVDSGLTHDVYYPGQGQLYVPDIDVAIGFPDTPAEPFQHIEWVSAFHAAVGERADSSPVP